MTTQIYALRPGQGPLVLSLPHTGTHIPRELRKAYLPRALASEDTDWHLERLYAFALDCDVTVMSACVSRYVIDVNRSLDGTPMYPGASNTELCPTRFFTGEPLYANGYAPDTAEIARRIACYWRPYRDSLATLLEATRARHGYAILWEGHSIRSRLPWLFEGKLPDLNLGTANGASCDPRLRTALVATMDKYPEFTRAVDGRFKGGDITRHFGRPAKHIHALQLEMCQSTYMNEAPPFAYLQERAQAVEPVLVEMLAAALAWRPRGT